MKKSILSVVAIVVFSASSLSALGQPTVSTQAMGGGNPRPQATGGGNPRPQAMGGGNPLPQSTIATVVSVVLGVLGIY